MFCRTLFFYEKIDSNRWADPLGNIYEELTSKSKSSALGQFFTPEDICNLMAQMVIEKDWGKKIVEPCCGSGRMILAANSIQDGNEYVAQDIDHICCKMTALNMAFHRIRGTVYHMDALQNSEPWNVYLINFEFWKHKTINILQY